MTTPTLYIVLEGGCVRDVQCSDPLTKMEVKILDVDDRADMDADNDAEEIRDFDNAIEAAKAANVLY